MLPQALNLEEAIFITKDFLESKFSIREFPTVKINGRLGRATLGWFYPTRQIIEIAKKIESWGHVDKQYMLQSNISTLLHECTHYALWYVKEQFNDGDYDFELEITKWKIESNYTYGELFKKWKSQYSEQEYKEKADKFVQCTNKREDLNAYYENIILERRKQQVTQQQPTRVAKKKIGGGKKQTTIILDGIKIVKESKSEMQKYIRQEFGLPCDGYWFMEDELPLKHRPRVTLVQVGDEIIYKA